MTEIEQRNLATAHLYLELYNSDIERFVQECYTSDCKVYMMGYGVVEGPKKFLKMEQKVLQAAPRRRMRLDHTHVTGDVVTFEGAVLNPDAGDDWELPFAAVLVMRDGKIAIDRTYADYTRWPYPDDGTR